MAADFVSDDPAAFLLSARGKEPLNFVFGVQHELKVLTNRAMAAHLDSLNSDPEVAQSQA